jgi:enoyl-CoA hydratase/carnithine racemase
MSRRPSVAENGMRYPAVEASRDHAKDKGGKVRRRLTAVKRDPHKLERTNVSALNSYPKLRVEIDGGVARLLIDHPERHNAFDFSMWRALPSILSQLDKAEDVRVIVLTSPPSLPFCSGADITEFSTLRATAEGGHAYEQSNVAAFDALSQMSKPVIAAICGFCMGGGMGLAAACDLRIAAQDATFAIPAGRLGVGYPPAAMKYIVAAVGAQTAFDLFFTARRIDAEHAQATGFVSRICRMKISTGRSARSRRASPTMRRSPCARPKPPFARRRNCRARDRSMNAKRSRTTVSTARTMRRGAPPFSRSVLQNSPDADAEKRESALCRRDQ